MRKILSSILLIAVAAMTSVSCINEDTAPVNETKSSTISLSANVVDTKTYIVEDEEVAVLWGNDEYVQLYYNDGTNHYVKSKDNVDAFYGKATATFSFDIEYEEVESYILGGVYPASAVTSNDDETAPNAYKVDLPATQTATASSYDPTAFIMIMKPQTVDSFDETAYPASFRRASALNKITLKGLKETINSITFTVPEDKYLAGRRYFDLTSGVEGEIYHAKSNTITVNGTYSAGDVDVWFTSWGVDLAEGDEMTIKMSSATKTYTRTITVKENGIKFIEGALNKLTVNMSSAEEVVLNDLSGEYLIVNTTLTRAAQAWNNGNNLPEYVLTVEEGKIIESDGLENCKMTIELQIDGTYTVKDAKNKYLYAPSASNNYVNGLDEISDQAHWTIVEDGENYVLTSLGNNSRNILRYNSSNKIFSCYSSGQAAITLYKYSEIEPDTKPRIIIAENTSASIGAQGGDLTFTCTLKNLDGETLEVTEESEYLTWAVLENVVTITIAANDGSESRTLNATITCGTVEVPVTITQAGKPAEDAKIMTWSWEGGVKSGFESLDNVTANGLGSDYAATHNPYNIKLDGTGDYFTVKVDGAIQNVTIGVKMIGGANTSSLDIQGSVDGTLYASVEKLEISGKQNAVLELTTTKSFDSSYRYLKFYFTKGSNVGIGPISISYISSEGGENEGDETPDAGVTPEQSSVEFTFSSADAVTKEGITVEFAQGSGSSTPLWTSSQLRLYANNTIVVSSSEKTITKVEYTFTKQGSKAYATVTGDATYESGGVSTGNDDAKTDVWMGSSKKVTVTLGASGQRVLKSIVVYTN